MGTVYEAVQENLGRRVALKLLDERLSYDREQLERFRREAEVVAALGHPNIVQVTDFQYPSELGKQPFLVMELLRGESLAGRIEHDGAMAFERVAFIVAQVLSALGAAHRAGVVHRDVKPDNIFLLADAAIPDTVKVLDFGIAKLSDGASIGPAQQKLTSTNAMLGTPAFMAPEQARGADDVDARADVYAVGATMYQALTGKMPFEAASVPALLFAIVEKTPPPLRELRPDVPADFIAVVERAMAKRREDRFQTTDEMRAALAPWSGLPASNPTPPIASPRALIESAPTAIGGNSIGTAATIASNPPPGAVATPMVVHRTPAPMTPVVPYAPRGLPDAVAAKRKNRTVIILAVLATLAVFKIVNMFQDRDRNSDRHHARADDSAATEFGQSVARSVTSMGLNAAAQAMGVAPPPSATATATATASAPTTTITSTATATASTTATATATATASTVASAAPSKLKRYGGKEGWKSGGDFSGCPTCDWQAFYNDMGMRVADTSKCFAASEHEPPLHETPYYWMSVDASGHITVTNAPGGAPNLDRCLLRVIQSVGVKGGPGTFKVGFQGECTRGCNGCCD
jgi:serine/threonine-protein kinase